MLTTGEYKWRVCGYSLYYLYNFSVRLKIFKIKKAGKRKYHVKNKIKKICWAKDKMQETKLWWGSYKYSEDKKSESMTSYGSIPTSPPYCLWIFYHMPHSLQIRNQTHSHDVRIINAWPCVTRKRRMRSSFYGLNCFLSSFLETWSPGPSCLKG